MAKTKKQERTINVKMFPLVELIRLNGQSSIAVPIDHSNLDDLIGRLMQMCDLIGDTEQRRALKDTIKRISRDWLNSVYEENGYERFYGPQEFVDIVKAKEYEFDAILDEPKEEK